MAKGDACSAHGGDWCMEMSYGCFLLVVCGCGGYSQTRVAVPLLSPDTPGWLRGGVGAVDALGGLEEGIV